MYREGIIKSFLQILLFYTINKLYVYTQLKLTKLCQRMTLTNVLDATSYAGPHLVCMHVYIIHRYTLLLERQIKGVTNTTQCLQEYLTCSFLRVWLLINLLKIRSSNLQNKSKKIAIICKMHKMQ